MAQKFIVVISILVLVLFSLFILQWRFQIIDFDKMSVDKSKNDKLLFFEDFSKGMDNWWVEGSRNVSVKNERLYVIADSELSDKNVCTVWCKKIFPPDIQVSFDAHIVQSSIGVNNINFFLCYSDPSGKPLYETRKSRKSGKYSLYHNLRGNIFTYLSGGTHPDGSPRARFRIRHNPGFNLLSETYDYHCVQGKTYHVKITKLGKILRISVDGKEYLSTVDENPCGSGLIGLRTFQTYLWWDNIKVTEVKEVFN